MNMIGKTPNPKRVWVCEECGHSFTDKEVWEAAISKEWAHPCKMHPCRKGQRCESYLTPFMPEEDNAKGGN